MTERERNDAIEYIKAFMKIDERLHKISPKETVAFFTTRTCLKYWDMAIKALEQMEALDKIRAEIEENINYNKKMNYQGIVSGLLLTLDIIDKYRKVGE